MVLCIVNYLRQKAVLKGSLASCSTLLENGILRGFTEWFMILHSYKKSLPQRFLKGSLDHLLNDSLKKGFLRGSLNGLSF